MEHKILWKNFLLLMIAGLVTLHLNFAVAAESSQDSGTGSDTSEECVLEQE